MISCLVQISAVIVGDHVVVQQGRKFMLEERMWG